MPGPASQIRVAAEGTAGGPQLVERLHQLEKRAKQLRMPIAYESMIYCATTSRSSESGQGSVSPTPNPRRERNGALVASSIFRRNRSEAVYWWLDPDGKELSALVPQLHHANSKEIERFATSYARWLADCIGLSNAAIVLLPQTSSRPDATQIW